MEQCEWCGSAKSVQNTTSLIANKVGPSLCAVCRGYPSFPDEEADKETGSRDAPFKMNFNRGNLYVITAAQLLASRSL